MTESNKKREWTLCFGEYDDPAWNGPLFDGNVKVIEKSAYDESLSTIKVLKEALSEIGRTKYGLELHMEYVADYWAKKAMYYERVARIALAKLEDKNENN